MEQSKRAEVLSVTESTDVGEFEKFVDRIPEETAQSLRFVPVQENKAADVPVEGGP